MLGSGATYFALRSASTASLTSSVMEALGMSMVMVSPSSIRPMGPPEAASGLTWPMAAPRDAPEKRPSVMSATVLSSFMPASAEVGLSISRIPGPPLGPS